MNAEAAALTRCDTGTNGLDHILGGGFPPHALYLLQGDPGVGKTTLAVQFLLAGSRKGESCLYVTFSETREELFAVARSHGWSLEGIGVAIATGQKPTLSQCGIGLSQRAKAFAMEFPFDVKAVLSIGVDVRVARGRQMQHIAVIHVIAFGSQLI